MKLIFQNSYKDRAAKLVQIEHIENENERIVKLNKDVVKTIKESISNCGQLEPIGVSRIKTYENNGPRYKLIWGMHRLEAVKALKNANIVAVIYDDITPQEAEILEITENYASKDLGLCEKILCTNKINFHYINAGAHHGKGSAGSNQYNKNKVHNSSSTSLTADFLSVSTETVLNRQKIYNALGEKRLRILRATTLDNFKKLQKIAKAMNFKINVDPIISAAFKGQCYKELFFTMENILQKKIFSLKAKKKASKKNAAETFDNESVSEIYKKLSYKIINEPLDRASLIEALEEIEEDGLLYINLSFNQLQAITKLLDNWSVKLISIICVLENTATDNIKESECTSPKNERIDNFPIYTTDEETSNAQMFLIAQPHLLEKSPFEMSYKCLNAEQFKEHLSAHKMESLIQQSDSQLQEIVFVDEEDEDVFGLSNERK